MTTWPVIFYSCNVLVGIVDHLTEQLNNDRLYLQERKISDLIETKISVRIL